MFYHLKMKKIDKVIKKYYLLTAETKTYNVMIDERNVFDQTVNNDLITYDNMQEITPGQGDDETAGCLLTKQQKLDADPKAIQQINFTGNLDKAEGATMFFIIEEGKETVLDFSKGTVKVLGFFCLF